MIRGLVWLKAQGLKALLAPLLRVGSAMFSDCSSDEGPAPAAEVPDDGLTHRQRNAAVARKARAEKHIEQECQRDDANSLVATTPWPSAGKAQAARALLLNGLGASLSAFTRNHGVDYGWAQRLLLGSASRARELEHQAFRALLQGIASAAHAHGPDVFRASLFCWQRAYDETPRLCRIRHQTDDGDLVTEAAPAKIMAALLSFAVTLHWRPPPSDQSEALAPWEMHIIRGTLCSTLVPVVSQTVAVVARYLEDHVQIPSAELVARVFEAVVTLRCSDSHRSYAPAERLVAVAAGVADSHLAKPKEAKAKTCSRSTGFFRCSMHRIRTAEKELLDLDSAAEGLLLHFTLGLHGADAIRRFRASVEEWIRSPGVLDIRHGLPPPEVQAWRKNMEQVLFEEAGPQTEKALRRRMCWDLLTNGDLRIRGQVQHYCPGASCCTSRSHTIQKLLGPFGVQAFLSPPPNVFPRKSWSGQAEVAAHVLQMELIAGMISKNFAAISHFAGARLEQARQRCAAVSRAAGEPEEDEARADVAAARAKALHAEQFAEEHLSGCQRAVAFLGGADVVPRLIRLMVLLRTFDKLKAVVLHRNGETWELSAKRDAVIGQERRFAIMKSAHAEELIAAMSTCTLLMGKLSSPSWCLAGFPPETPQARLSRWVMAAKAAAAIRGVHCEVTVYPWRLFALFCVDREEGAAVFAREAQVCHRRCFLDELSRLHWERHPSVAELLSDAAIADLEAMATLVRDNTSHLERVHAGTRRTARSREDTYLEHVEESSAARILRSVRRGVEGGIPQEGASATGEPCGPAVSRVAKKGGRNQRRKAKTNRPHVAPPKQRKKRRIDRKNAWTAENVVGRLLTQADHAQYQVDMDDLVKRARYEQLAEAMNRAQDSENRRPRRDQRGRDWVRSWALRCRRRKARLLKKPWDARTEALALERDPAFQLHQQVRRRVRELRGNRAAKRSRIEAGRALVNSWRDGTADAVSLGARPADIGAIGKAFAPEVAASLVPEPNGCSGKRFFYEWCPREASVPRLLAEQPGITMANIEKRIGEWQRLHCKVTTGVSRKGTRLNPKDGLCLRWCRCLCSDRGAGLVNMVGAFGRACHRAMGIAYGRSGAGRPKTAERQAVEVGEAVVRVASAKESRWLHVGREVYAAGGLPLLLEVRERHVRGESTELQAMVDGDVFVEAPTLVEELCRDDKWYLQLYRLTDARPTTGDEGTCITVQPMGEAVEWWPTDAGGVEAVAEALEAAGEPDEPDDAPDEGAASPFADGAPDVAVPPDASVDDAAVAGDAPALLPDPEEEEEEEEPADKLDEARKACRTSGKKGVRLTCTACRAGGKEALTYWLTYKEGAPGKNGSYQILCDYHEPDVIVRANGSTYKLACRKTRTVAAGTAEAERDTIKFLLRWLRRGPCCGSRAEHRDLAESDFDVASSASSSSSSSSSDSSEVELCGGGVSPAAVCWVCDQAHTMEECPQYQLAVHNSKLTSRKALRPLGVIKGRDGCVLAAGTWAVRDVPADGDCLFHSLGKEIAGKFPHHAALPAEPLQGSSWRAFLMEFAVESSDVVMDDLTVAEWLAIVCGQTVEEYVSAMHVVRGRETWGGMIDASFLASAWSRRIGQDVAAILLAENADGAMQALAWLGPRTAAETICAAWQGNHWVRARLRPAATEVVRAWAVAP